MSSKDPSSSKEVGESGSEMEINLSQANLRTLSICVKHLKTNEIDFKKVALEYPYKDEKSARAAWHSVCSKLRNGKPTKSAGVTKKTPSTARAKVSATKKGKGKAKNEDISLKSEAHVNSDDDSEQEEDQVSSNFKPIKKSVTKVKPDESEDEKEAGEAKVEM